MYGLINLVKIWGKLIIICMIMSMMMSNANYQYKDFLDIHCQSKDMANFHVV